MEYAFQLIEPTEHDWQEIESSAESTCFHSRQWSKYLDGVGKRHFIVSIAQEGRVAGYFVGARQCMGLVLGSPVGSAGTYVQGICMKEPVADEVRLAIYQQLFRWARKCHHVHFMQVSDWRFHTVHDDYIPVSEWHHPALSASGIHYSVRSTLFVDTRADEKELWEKLSYKSCKYSINKARKNGLHVCLIEKEEEIPGFVEIHRRQIEDVFHRKGMSPMFYQKKKNLLAICQSLFPEKILMLQVWGNDDEGREQCMSSAIFCPGKSASTYFTGASFQRYMKFSPNELMVWEGMRLLHERGAGDLIFTGIAHYKKKFGTSYAYLPMMVFTTFGILFSLRVFIKKSYGFIRNLFRKK